MAYTEAEARERLLDELADATDHLGEALTSLGAAYEQLDEQQADRLEEQLFRPVQRAYGRAKRTHAQFASRYRLGDREFTMRSPGVRSTGVLGFIEDAVRAVERADLELVALQESSIAIEVGDVNLRAGVAEVRQLIDGVSEAARSFERSFGR
jgi:hypothetical protein